MTSFPRQHRADATATQTGRYSRRPTPAGKRGLVLASVGAGTVEYRMHGDGPGTVLVFHGGHVRAELAMGEDVFTNADSGCSFPRVPATGVPH
jgi:hypothetical protein